MKMMDNENKIISKAIIPFRSKTYTASSVDRNKITKNIYSSMLMHCDKIEAFINNGSNWVFNKPVAMDVEIGGVNPLLVGSNMQNLEVDILNIPNKKHLINVHSKDNKCFLYCIAEAINGFSILDKNSTREYEKFVNSYITNNITFPISIKGIKKFLKQNSLDIKINLIFLSRGKKIYPLQCGMGKGSKVINLLCIPFTNKEGDSFHHFLLIKNLDKYLSKTYSSEKRNYYENSFYCPNCFNKFSKKYLRDNHEIKCISQKAQIEKVPNIDNNKIYFKNFVNQYQQDLIAFLDFECELPKIDDICKNCLTTRCKCNESYTRFETQQKPICFAFFIINKKNDIIYKKIYSGKDAGDVFLNDLFTQEKIWILAYLNKIEEMKKLNEEEEIMYNISTSCYICNKDFSEEDPKVRDHDHSDGFFISAAHRSCNLKRSRQNTLKIFMHNGSKYDFHFLVKSLAKKKLKNLYILPYNMEHFRMIKFNSFMLLDSLAFMQSSLSQLADELKLSNHDYPIITKTDLVKTNGYFDKEKFNMILQKGFFPYEFW